jgi:hypothetical protein
MAFSATQSQNCGPSGGGVASFGAANIETSGTANLGVIKIAGDTMIPGMARIFRGSAAAASIATAGAGSPTAANLLTGTIVRDCTGSSRTDTLPTAALLVAAITTWTPAIGDVIECLYINGSDPTTEVITIAEGSGGGWDTNQTAVSRTILGTCSKLLRIRLTNVTASSESYVVYG